MTKNPNALLLNVSPGFRGLDRPLLKYLATQTSIARWDYCQTQDEPISLNVAQVLLHDYLKAREQPVHLIGHSTAGLVALLYARAYPERVRSLTLLSVGAQPAIDWQAHYYMHLKLLACSRDMILGQMAYTLFGYQPQAMMCGLVNLLKQDLAYSPSPHSLLNGYKMDAASVPVPLLVSRGEEDVIVDERAFLGWKPWLKPSDRLWQCPGGRYFFHYAHPELMGRQIVRFWRSLGSGLSSLDTLSLPA